MNMDQRRAEINRRSLLCAIPGIIGAGAATAAITVTSETPVMVKYREWVAYTAWINTEAGDLPEAEWQAAVGRQTDLEDEIVKTPAETQLDVIAKIAAWTSFGMFGLADTSPVWDEARKILNESRPRMTGKEFEAEVSKLPQKEQGQVLDFLRNLAGRVA